MNGFECGEQQEVYIEMDKLGKRVGLPWPPWGGNLHVEAAPAAHNIIPCYELLLPLTSAARHKRESARMSLTSI